MRPSDLDSKKLELLEQNEGEDFFAILASLMLFFFYNNSKFITQQLYYLLIFITIVDVQIESLFESCYLSHFLFTLLRGDLLRPNQFGEDQQPYPALPRTYTNDISA